MKMNEIDWDTYSTVQECVCSIFDSLGRVEIGQNTIQLKQKREQLLQKLMSQNINYGNKIIELSEKFTSKYRKENFVQRKLIQYQLATIYKLAVRDQLPNLSAEQLAEAIVETLQEEKRLKIPKFSIAASRLQFDDARTQNKNIITPHHYLEEHRPSNTEKHSPKKLKKSTISRKGKEGKETDFTMRQILTIKNYFDNESSVFRQSFEKVVKIFDSHKINTINIDCNKLKFSSLSSQAVTDNMTDFIKNATQNHTINLNNLMALVDLLNDNYSRKLKLQGFAQSKFSLYLKQIERRQEVYSYAVSRMLQHLSNLAIMLKNSEIHPALSLLQNIEDIARKFYDLYPSNQIIKNISVEHKDKMIQDKKNQGIQVNTFKSNNNNDLKKPNIQMYRLQIKIVEAIQKYQKSFRLKKSVDVKEIDKFLQFIRQCLPGKPTALTTIQASEINNFQQQFHKLIQLYDKNQKQIIESFSKKNRKLEKKITQLETSIQDLQNEIKNLCEQKQSEKKKYQRKIEVQKLEIKKIQNQKEHYEKNISQMIKQIQQMKEAIKNQNQFYTDNIKSLTNQKDLMQKKLQNQNQNIDNMNRLMREEKQQMLEQKNIFKQKIMLLQKHQQKSKINEQQVKNQLQTMISDNTRLREQLQQMTTVYEDKIKEVEDMIQNIQQLQHLKHKYQVQLQQLTQSQKISKHQNIILQEEIKNTKKQSERLLKQKNELKNDCQKYRQMGLLNESDIRVLKQQMDKVSKAYLQGEQQIQMMKTEIDEIKIINQKLQRQKIKYNRIIEDLQNQISVLKSGKIALQTSDKDLRSNLYQKTRQSSYLHKQLEDTKKQLLKYKKQLSQIKDLNSIYERQLRQMRQEIQKKKEQENLQNGKKRIQLQAMKVQLRKKNEQCQKQREGFEQKVNILQSKIKEMESFITQKQLLARITNSHQSM